MGLVERTYPCVLCFDTLFWLKYERDVAHLRTHFNRKVELKNLMHRDTLLLENFDLLLFPIHRVLGQTSHWFLIACDISERAIHVIDSFNLHAQQYFYYTERIEFLLKQVLGPKDWGVCYYDNLPRQQNGEDCGVALCINAAQLAKC